MTFQANYSDPHRKPMICSFLPQICRASCQSWLVVALHLMTMRRSICPYRIRIVVPSPLLQNQDPFVHKGCSSQCTNFCGTKTSLDSSCAQCFRRPRLFHFRLKKQFVQKLFKRNFTNLLNANRLSPAKSSNEPASITDILLLLR